MFQYILLFIFLISCLILSTIVFLLSYILANQVSDSEKLSAYECGFQPFEDARTKFHVRFYLVSILFIIFDLEIAYLFPWGITLNDLNYYSFWGMILFLLILTVGFVYEWMKGALTLN